MREPQRDCKALPGGYAQDAPPFQPRATVAAGATFRALRLPAPVGAAVVTRATVAARATLVTREPLSRCLVKGKIPLNIAGLATVKPLENMLSILLAKHVPQLVEADDSRFDPLLLSKEIGHRLRELAVVGDTRRRPLVGTPKRPSLPPPPHDDDETTFAQNRVSMLAGRADAQSPVASPRGFSRAFGVFRDAES